jgi:hypothetical protein
MKNIILILISAVFLNCLNAQKLLPLKNGVQTAGSVSALDYDPATSTLYIGGTFDMIDSVPANNIASWDGTTLNTFGSGINGDVMAVKEMNGVVYAGGYYLSINDGSVNSIAQWSGTQWTAVGNGLGGYSEVQFLTTYNNQMWAAGHIKSNADTAVNDIAVWNGSEWAFPNTGLNFYGVNGLKVINNLLYVFGPVSLPGLNYSVGGAAFYNGSKWQLLPFDTAGYSINDLGLLNDTLTSACEGGMKQLVNGAWKTINNINVNKLFDYKGNLSVVYPGLSGYEQFYPIVNDTLGQPFGNIYTGEEGNFYVSTVITSGNNLFAGGNFYQNLNTYCASLVSYNGDTWGNPALVAGGSYIDQWHYSNINSSIYDSVTGRLYVGGYFLFAGNNLSPNVAYWDGQNWQAMGNGLNATVVQLIMYEGSVYACGYFTASGADAMSYIARWDGTKWNAVADADNYVLAMYVLNGSLYIGGNFSYINNVSAVNVARFNGTSWQAVAGNNLNANDGVSLLSSWQGNLIAANHEGFTYNSPATYNVIWIQNGAWQQMGDEISSPPSAFYTDGLGFYAFDAPANGNAVVYSYLDNTWGLYSIVGGSSLQAVSAASLTSVNGELIESEISFGWGTYAALPDSGHWLWELFTTGFYQIDSSSYYLAGYFPWMAIDGRTVNFNNAGVITLAPPVINIEVNTDTICKYGYVHYAPELSDLTASIEWYMPGGFPDTSTQLFPVVQYSTAGKYAALATVKNPYGSNTFYLADSIVVLDPCVLSGVNQFEQNELHIFPNPANNQVYIETGDRPVLKIQLLDLSGKRVLSIPGSQNTEQSFNVNGLAGGMYFITVITTGGSLTEKLVIQ